MREDKYLVLSWSTSVFLIFSKDSLVENTYAIAFGMPAHNNA